MNIDQGISAWKDYAANGIGTSKWTMPSDGSVTTAQRKSGDDYDLFRTGRTAKQMVTTYHPVESNYYDSDADSVAFM